jgi:signal transduction protein with GAF and PtsI domain
MNSKAVYKSALPSGVGQKSGAGMDGVGQYRNEIKYFFQ